MEQIGLSAAEAESLRIQGKVNRIEERSHNSVRKIILSNVFTYFNGIFAFLAVLLIVTGTYKALTFLPVVIANTLIGIVQQLRAKKVLDQLALLDVSQYRTIRDGKEVLISSEELVLGDVIILEGGQQIPADGVVVSGEAGVNESLLTGEADEIEKQPGDELMSGSFLVAGELTARLTRVGADSYAAKLTAKAKEDKASQSEMIHDIELIVKCAGILIIPIGGALFYQAVYVNGLSVQTGVSSMVSAVIGMIPEGLYLLVTIALALSAARLAMDKVLLHDMHSIEMLARVDVLCVDKTGTITSDEMNVSGIFYPVPGTCAKDTPETERVSEIAPETEGISETVSEAEKVSEIAPETEGISEAASETERVSESAPETEGISEIASETEDGFNQHASQTGSTEPENDSLTGDKPSTETMDPEKILASYVRTVPDTNITMNALRAYLGEAKPLEYQSVTPFRSATKYSEVKTAGGCYRLGAPEYLLSKESMEQNREEIEKRAGAGQRVMALTKDGVPILFVSLHNEIRENAKETFRGFEEQGVQIKVISGDNPLTVSRVAAEAGIENADQYVDAGTLETTEMIRDAVMKYTVFGRVKPEQKKELVKALQFHKKKVAMTGDGVNDILAMKKADCSIAMGGGSDAARQAAQVVLLDSDFSHMKKIVSEGRRDINNITRSATLFLYKNIFSLLLAVFSIYTSFVYPLQPMQVSLISMFNIGIPAMMLALEPNEKKQEGHFIRKTLTSAFPASLTSFFAISAMVMFADLFGISESDVSIASTYLLSLVGFMVLWKITRPMNKYRLSVILICITGFLLANRFMYRFLDLSDFSLKAGVLCILFAIAEMSVMRELTVLGQWLDEHIRKRYGKKPLPGGKISSSQSRRT